MIKNIIFDLGDIFISIDESQAQKEFKKLGFNKFTDKMLEVNKQYEKGLISTEGFLKFYRSQFPAKSEEELIKIWNCILIDFPKNRLSFLEKIHNDFRLFLLSNTNKLHINHFKEQVGYDFYSRFYNYFEKVYYSNEIKLRKPETEVFQFILSENNLKANETLFIDDKVKNTDSAKKIGIEIWNLDPLKEDVIELFDKFPYLK
ncbi:MAG: HAD family phosphatase [Bacteroidota bacterium]